MNMLPFLLPGLMGPGVFLPPGFGFGRSHHPGGGTKVPRHIKKARNRRRNRQARAARRRNR